MLDQNKVVIEGKKTTTTIRTESETGEKLTKAIQNIQETGLPSNDDLDTFGDQIIEFIKKTKKSTSDPKAKELAGKAQKVVEDVKSAIHERNYDEKLQEITRKLKDEPINIPVSGKDGEYIAETFKQMGPYIVNLGKMIMTDMEIRKLIVSIIEVLTGATSRAASRISDRNPNVMETLKDDVLDVETPGINKTATVVKEALQDAPKQVNMTEDEKAYLRRRALKAFNKIRNKADYQNFFENLFSLFDRMLDIWYRLKSKPQLLDSYSAQINLFADIRVMIERSCGRSLGPWIKSIKRMSDVTENRTYIKIRQGIEEIIVDRDSKYRTEEALGSKIDKLQAQMNKLNSKYENVLKDVLDESQKIFYGFANDPVLNQIRQSFNELILDIFVDENGKPSVNAITNSLVRIRDVFFPIIKDKITHISLPTLEFDSKKYFFRFSDIKINTGDLIPDQLKVESDFNISIDLNELKRKGDFTVRVKLDPFNADVEGLNFLIKKKTGIRYKDYGTVDILLRESSILLEFHVKLLADEVDYVELSKVVTDLSGLKVKINQAKHDIIDKLALSVFLPTIRVRLQNTINSAITESLNKGIFDRLNTSLRELNYKKKTGQLELKEKKSKKVKKEKKVNVEIDKENKSAKIDLEKKPKVEGGKKEKKVDIEMKKEKKPKVEGIKKEKKPKTEGRVDIDIEKRSSKVEEKHGSSELYAQKPSKTEVKFEKTNTITPQDLKEASADISITEKIIPKESTEVKTERSEMKVDSEKKHKHDKEQKAEIKITKEKGDSGFKVEANLTK